MGERYNMNLRLPVFAVVFVTLLRAQLSARPEFEVASFKPNASANPGFAIRAIPLTNFDIK